MKKDFQFVIAGARWLWRYTRLRGQAIGWTYSMFTANPKSGGKILIDDRLKRRMKLEVEIHEFLHAANPTLSEEHVTIQARDLAKILWWLGYRTEGARDASDS